MKVGRVAIITRGRYAGKKVRQPPSPNRSTHNLKEQNGNAMKNRIKRRENTTGLFFSNRHLPEFDRGIMKHKIRD